MDTKIENYTKFYSFTQQHTLNRLIEHSEEASAFRVAVERVNRLIKRMPVTNELPDPELLRELELLDPRVNLSQDPVCFLHYFIGNADWYIIEKDMDGDVDQAFGYACLGDLQNAELGHISIRVLTQIGAELDLYFRPSHLSEVKQELADRFA